MRQARAVDWTALEQELALTNDFEERIKVFAGYFSLVKAGGRVYTLAPNGQENVKVFCLCSNCRNADPEFDQHLAIYHRYLYPELKEIDSHLKSLTDYKKRLDYFEEYFDRNGNYEYPETCLKFSIQPQTDDERKIFNKGTYDQVLQHYFLTISAIPQYFQKDFNYRRSTFEQQQLNALYPEELKQKEIEKTIDHYRNQTSVLTARIFASLVDGVLLDDFSHVWDWNYTVALVDANEGFLFLKYLEGQKKATPGKPVNALHYAIQAYLRQDGPYPVISWGMANEAIAEIKEKLYELTNTDSRVAYLKTSLISFKIKGFEDMFKEAEGFIGQDFDVSHSSEGNIAIITDHSKAIPFHAGLYSIIHGRNYIVIELSEHIAAVYKEIDFNAVMKAADYRTRTTFWISANNQPQAPKGLTKREQAKLYLYKTELNIEPYLRTADFKKQYPGKNLELARNEIQSNKKPVTKKELLNILKYLKSNVQLPQVQAQITKDLKSPLLH